MVALADYLICPYDLEKAKTWAADWVIYRCAVNIFITLTYFGFWSLTLYSLGYGKRKFNPDYVATPSRMFHNIWYCVLGAIQLGFWEALFMNCYATGKLDYIKNEEVGPPLLLRLLYPAMLVSCPQPSPYRLSCRPLPRRKMPSAWCSSRWRSHCIAPCTSTSRIGSSTSALSVRAKATPRRTFCSRPSPGAKCFCVWQCCAQTSQTSTCIRSIIATRTSNPSQACACTLSSTCTTTAASARR